MEKCKLCQLHKQYGIDCTEIEEIRNRYHSIKRIAILNRKLDEEFIKNLRKRRWKK